MRVPGKATTSAWYLGPHLQEHNFYRNEVGNRMAVGRRNFVMLGKCWASTSNNRWKGIVFKAAVQSAQESALEALPVGKTNLESMDRQVATLARKALLGACAFSEVAHPVAQQTKFVSRQLRLRLPSVQIAMRKLRWWQTMVRRPADHILLLASVFAAGPWDKQPPLLQCNAGGKLHPFLAETLEVVEQVARFTPFEEYIDDFLKAPLLVFKDPEVQEEFLRIDPKVLAAQFQTVAIPPPAFRPPPGLQAPDGQRIWRCGILSESGVPCPAALETRKGLIVHKVHSNAFGHGEKTVRTLCLGQPGYLTKPLILVLLPKN